LCLAHVVESHLVWLEDFTALSAAQLEITSMREEVSSMKRTRLKASLPPKLLDNYSRGMSSQTLRHLRHAFLFPRSVGALLRQARVIVGVVEGLLDPVPAE
jgi:hypothetical protein